MKLVFTPSRYARLSLCLRVSMSLCRSRSPHTSALCDTLSRQTFTFQLSHWLSRTASSSGLLVTCGVMTLLPAKTEIEMNCNSLLSLPLSLSLSQLVSHIFPTFFRFAGTHLLAQAG